MLKPSELCLPCVPSNTPAAVFEYLLQRHFNNGVSLSLFYGTSEAREVLPGFMCGGDSVWAFWAFFSLLFDYSLFLVVIEVVVEVAVVVVFIIIEIVITPTTILYIYVLTLTAVGQGKCKARFEAFYSPLVTSDSTFIFSLLW